MVTLTIGTSTKTEFFQHKVKYGVCVHGHNSAHTGRIFLARSWKNARDAEALCQLSFIDSGHEHMRRIEVSNLPKLEIFLVVQVSREKNVNIIKTD